MAIRAQSLPSVAFPFPRTISDPPSPSECGSSDANLPFLARSETPPGMADSKRGSQVKSSPKRQTSLRWLRDYAAHSHPGSATLARVPSLSSTTTTTDSTLQRTGDLIPGGGDAAAENKVAPFHPQPHDRRMGSTQNNQRGTRSVLQFFARSLTRKKSASDPLQSTSSQSLPVTPDPSADTFGPRTILAKPSLDPQYEHALASPSEDLHMLSDPVHKTFNNGVLIVDEKSPRRDGAASRTTQISRRKSTPPHLETKQQVHFDPGADLTLLELESSRSIEVFDQDGKGVKFEDLWKGQRTCVIFIRHFWCPLCMDYTRSIVEQADPNVLRRAGVRLVVISNGSPSMIKSYLGAFKFPFPMYTDPSLSVYRALGMTLRTLDGGPDTERGEYVKHGKAAGIAMVLRNAVRARMPIHKSGGDIKQLGGEFVLGPGIRCSYTSRMRNTRSHTPILDVLSAAGVAHKPEPVVDVQPQTIRDEEQWMKEREDELRRIRAKKGLRRGYVTERRSSEEEIAAFGDDES